VSNELQALIVASPDSSDGVARTALGNLPDSVEQIFSVGFISLIPLHINAINLACNAKQDECGKLFPASFSCWTKIQLPLTTFADDAHFDRDHYGRGRPSPGRRRPP
jgi:hypothetical protein